MSEENNKDSNIRSTIDAVTGLAKAIPVYDDAIQPAAKEIGKSLATVAKTINIALAPVSALVWGFEKIQDFVLNRVSEKLKDRPEEKIITPDPSIVGPSLEALRYTGNDLNLRELYASLIATSMDADKVQSAHPGFVEIIKNLSSDEALLMRFFYRSDRHALLDVKRTMKQVAGEFDLMRNVSLIGQRSGIKNTNLTSNYIDNLCRLGLMEIPSGRYLMDETKYEELKELENIKKYKEQIEKTDGQIIFNKKHTAITDFGKQFCSACITP
jgi:hypothetical protein